MTLDRSGKLGKKDFLEKREFLVEKEYQDIKGIKVKLGQADQTA